MPRGPADDRIAAVADGAPDVRPASATDDQFRDRLEHLPPGHPSSPYDHDGTGRTADSRLRESQDPDAWSAAEDVVKLTDAEWKEHVDEAQTVLADAHASGLATYVQHTVDRRHEIWSDDRALVHEEIVVDIIGQSADVPRDQKAIIAGGLGGAGKSTVLEQHAGIDRSQYLTINPDDIKEELASRGLVPALEGLTPMEATDLAHEETSYIAKMLASRARSEGINVIWDITMSSKESTEKRITELRDSGYQQIDGIFVDIPVATSVARADARHRQGQELYRAGQGLGGRLVPAEVIEAQADSEWGSQNRKTFEGVKQRCDNWSLYDNSVGGRAPVLIEARTAQVPDHEERT